MTPHSDEPFDKETILERLHAAWSADSSSLYTEENPAQGHCGVTALVIQDHFGGDIRKTSIKDEVHFYNYIDDERYDFTAEQFDDLPSYADLPSDRNEAFGSTNSEQYAVLFNRFQDTTDQ